MRYIVSSRIATLKVLLMAFFRVSTLRYVSSAELAHRIIKMENYTDVYTSNTK
jgi:hypothetical protein